MVVGGTPRRRLLLLAAVAALLLLLQAPGCEALFGRGKKKEAEKAAAAAEAAAGEAAAGDGKEAAKPAEKKRHSVAVSVYKLAEKTEALEGKNLSFAYDVNNLSKVPVAVTVNDTAGLAGLRIVAGEAVFTLDEVPPGARLRTIVTVVPSSERIIPATPATFTYTYKDPESGEEITEARDSSAPPPVEVLTWTGMRRAKKDYKKEWGLYLLGALPPVLIPLLVWLALSATNNKRFKKKRA